MDLLQQQKPSVTLSFTVRSTAVRWNMDLWIFENIKFELKARNPQLTFIMYTTGTSKILTFHPLRSYCYIIRTLKSAYLIVKHFGKHNTYYQRRRDTNRYRGGKGVAIQSTKGLYTTGTSKILIFCPLRSYCYNIMTLNSAYLIVKHFGKLLMTVPVLTRPLFNFLMSGSLLNIINSVILHPRRGLCALRTSLGCFLLGYHPCMWRYCICLSGARVLAGYMVGGAPAPRTVK